MKVAVSVMKVFEMETPETCDMDSLELLRYRTEVLGEDEDSVVGGVHNCELVLRVHVLERVPNRRSADPRAGEDIQQAPADPTG